MSRKHYKLIAEAIRRKLIASGQCRDAQLAMVRAVADALKADNSAFRYDTFFEACGLTAEEHFHG